MKIKDRNEIADAALEIIAFEGVDKLSMQSLAEHLEIAKSSIYNWFSSKEEILEYAFSEGHRRLMAKGFRLTLEGSSSEVLSKAAEGWSRIFSGDDTLPYLRTVFALRYSDPRAEEEERAIKLMIRSQIDVIMTSLHHTDPFLSSLFSSLLIEHLESVLAGGDEDFGKDAAAFARMLDRMDKSGQAG